MGKPRDPEVEARRKEVFDLLAKGWEPFEIAAHQGRKPYQVFKDMDRFVKQRQKDRFGSVDLHIALHEEKLRMLWRAVVDQATAPGKKGQFTAQERALAILDREAKFRGLDAETREKLRSSALNAVSEMDAFVAVAEGRAPMPDSAALDDEDDEYLDDEEDPDLLEEEDD